MTPYHAPTINAPSSISPTPLEAHLAPASSNMRPTSAVTALDMAITESDKEMGDTSADTNAASRKTSILSKTDSESLVQYTMVELWRRIFALGN